MKKAYVLAVTLIAFGLVGVIGCGPSTSSTPSEQETPAPAPSEKAPAPAAAEPSTPAPTETNTSEPATPAAPETPPATPAPSESTPAPQAAAPAPAGAPLTAESLTGTSWQAGAYKLTFNADGKLKVNDSIDGTWSVEGSKVKATAMGQDLEADIQGDKLLYQGKDLTKLQ